MRHPVTIIGIDCAVQAPRVGLARGEFWDGEGLLREVTVGGRGGTIADTVGSWMRASAGPVLLALDAPLGWPDALARALPGHVAGEHIPADANALFRRWTDHEIKRRLGKQPLDVGADRIARTAHAALQLLHELRHATGNSIPLLWAPTELEGAGAIEVYPAGTLLGRGLSPRGYKGEKGGGKRKAILAGLAQILDIRCRKKRMLECDDALDAALCVLAGVDFLRGEAVAPSDPELARKEGWIWVSGGGAAPRPPPKGHVPPAFVGLRRGALDCRCEPAGLPDNLRLSASPAGVAVGTVAPRDLVDALVQEFKARRAKPPSWAWPFPPSVPFVGERYQVGRGLLVYASAENFTWMKKPGVTVPARFRTEDAWDRYRVVYEAEGRDSASFFPVVGIQPVTDGGLLTAARFAAERLGLPCPDAPREFLETIAVSNWAKFTVETRRANWDYVTDVAKLKASLPFVAAELAALRPHAAILPHRIWGHPELSAAMFEASPETQFLPMPQCSGRVVRFHFGRYGAQAEALRSQYRGNAVARWVKNLARFANADLWRYLAMLDDVCREG